MVAVERSESIKKSSVKNYKENYRKQSERVRTEFESQLWKRKQLVNETKVMESVIPTDF